VNVSTAADPLANFLPAVARWFRETFSTPTPPQRLAWPAVARGESILLVAPTGSGKTLAAFLAAIDHLGRTPRTEPGVRILYVSPLKALNVDVARNLEQPLAGIERASHSDPGSGPLPPLTIGVRTGDTTPADRQRQVRHPPDILITTPESLHLLLTSRARETLRHVSHVIVDEIHALAPSKRGTFLALLLERLETIRPPGSRPLQRIGLSATQRPLETAAAFLAGSAESADGTTLTPRPVTLLDAGRRKDLDLQVILPGPADRPPGAIASVWPAIEARLVDLIRNHRSTIVFANNRRVAERLTAHLNEALAVELDPGDDDPIQSHHGSLSLDRRRSTEQRLKAGDRLARIGDRHGRRRAGLPGRVTRQRLARTPARGSGQPRRGPDLQGPPAGQNSRRPPRIRRAGPRHARRRD
jgi:ATP-dependent Lhr-like helicase